MPFIKICGVTEPDLLPFLAELGVGFVGAIHYEKSPRHNGIEQLRALRDACPEELTRVLVTVNADDATLDNLIEAYDPAYLQLHGDETPERVAEIKSRYNLPIIKAISVKTAADIEKTTPYQNSADHMLFDTKKPGMYGGTGEVFDWSVLESYDAEMPYFLSGGLTPQNTADALRATNPYALDISSGVEASPGIKDRQKIRAVMEEIRGA